MATARAQLIGSDLLVDGRKFVVLGAETHNSSSSTAEAIGIAFSRVRDIGANTVLAPVSWDLFEPDEGAFDTTLVDEMVAVSRREGLRLIPLWFGAWKNGQSTYAPSWVKRDTLRFPRAEITGHGPVEHLTPFATETTAADAAAFGTLMAHLNTTAADGTILMVQVENEVGLLGDSRDRSALADRMWSQAAPTDVISAVRSSPHVPVHAEWMAAGRRDAGSWREVFGESPTAHEAFMAFGYARHIEAVAAAGRREFEVPLFVNAWLNNPPGVGLGADDSEPNGPAEDIGDGETEDVVMAGGALPGSYPSGGPLPRVAPIWSAVAPTLDLLAPDVYFGDTGTIFRDFFQVASRLFIPEMRRSPVGVAQMFLAIGEYGAIGVSPFGVDSLGAGDPDEGPLRDGYSLLSHAVDLHAREPEAVMRGFALSSPDESAVITVGDYVVTVDCRDPFGLFAPSLPAYGLVVMTPGGVLTAIGRGFRLTFSRTDGRKAGILSTEELAHDPSGTPRVVRRWNGDETASGSGVRIPPLQNVIAVASPIPVMTSSTGVVRVSLYTYGDEQTPHRRRVGH